MSRGTVTPFKLIASGAIASQGTTVQAVRVHSMILTETAGATNATLSLYVPVESSNSAPIEASAAGTLIGTIIVPKGTTMLIPGLGDGSGLYFKNGLYISIAGGTLSGLLAIS